MRKRIYRIDHCYFYDSNKDCLLLETDLEPNDLAKIIVAIQFKFEELVDESLDIDPVHLLDILKEFYNVKDVKEKYRSVLKETEHWDNDENYSDEYDKFNYISKFELEELEVIKIEMYSARDKHCGSNYKEIYKYLVRNKELYKMISDYMKYPKEYEEYIIRSMITNEII
ncbi:Uncharacterised protein [[Clostridium] sordellii]|uniref:hypothetical protein n=1 Tax=Paraclostridium sordellii TaxID=1505 RepID=UPI0005DFF347|nr:hypothetical protein [Paeniclostridium sordellii]CEN25381.1 Uncharacterised protein [[Clostridium] sordellii] [Paeniclostridium sordellii]